MVGNNATNPPSGCGGRRRDPSGEARFLPRLSIRQAGNGQPNLLQHHREHHFSQGGALPGNDERYSLTYFLVRMTK